MNHLKRSFDSFFLGATNVAVIKGEWGVGKTYFWENYISTRIQNNDLGQIAYSYISLFGKSSLDDVRRSIFHNAKAISSGEIVERTFQNEFDKSSKLFNIVPWVKEGLNKAQLKSPWISWLSKYAGNQSVSGRFTGMISSLEYALVKNYVVCFDDLERKGKNLSVKEVMGLIDELAQRKSCKVILIFNQSSLENQEDKNEFESYREKVVDIEINHNPTCKENFECVFSRDSNGFSMIESAVNELNIKNIRVLRKIKWLSEQFIPYLQNKNEQLTNEFLLHATVLCWGFYIRNNEISFDTLLDQLSSKSWLSYLSGKDKELSDGEKKYRSIATNLRLSKSEFDRHIIFFLNHGYLDEDSLINTVDELEELANVDKARARLGRAWEIYSDSFSDNLDDFKNTLKNILEEESPRLGLSDFSSSIDILEEFGEDVSGYISNYVKYHSEKLKQFNPRHSWEMGRLSNVKLKNEIENLHQKNKILNIDHVSMKIAKNNSWSPEDIDYLCSLSIDDFVDWMKKPPEDIVTKIRSGLFIFRNLGTSNKSDKTKFENITVNVVGALKKIASENEFNKRRIKYIYEVE